MALLPGRIALRIFWYRFDTGFPSKTSARVSLIERLTSPQRKRVAMDAAPHTLLYVEDDVSLSQMVSDFLQPNGFAVTTESRGDRAVERIVSENPEVVLLDINLPGADGISICREARQRKYDGPIIILSARGDEVDEVIGLEVGADDYLAKPVRPRALLTRLRMHLRRHVATQRDDNDPIRVGDLVVDEGRRLVTLGGNPLDLTTAEFDLLALLAKSAGQVLPRADIYEKIHGMKHDGIDRSIDLRISRLRKKLGDSPSNPARIKSVRGVGYLLSL